MTPTGSDGSSSFARLVDVEEWRRRNPLVAAMDLLLLGVTGFFGHLLVRTQLGTLLAVLPLAALLYFGWRSSKPFFAAQVGVIAVVAVLTRMGISPI